MSIHVYAGKPRFEPPPAGAAATLAKAKRGGGWAVATLIAGSGLTVAWIGMLGWLVVEALSAVVW